MSTQERKDRLIQFIRNLSDPRLLERFEAMLPADTDWADSLTEEEKKGIKLAQQQVKEGKTKTSQEVWSQFDASFR